MRACARALLVAVFAALVLPAGGCAPSDPLVEKVRADLARQRAEEARLKAAFEAQLAAATAGDVAAQVAVAQIYAAGQGVDVDHREAVRWYRAAAEQGDAEARFRLAVMLDYGVGTDADPAEAARWYEAAAEQGHVKAQRTLASLYERGWAFRSITPPRCAGTGRRRSRAIRHPSRRWPPSTPGARAWPWTRRKPCAGTARRPRTAVPGTSTTWPSATTWAWACPRTTSRRSAGTAGRPSGTCPTRSTRSGPSTRPGDPCPAIRSRPTSGSSSARRRATPVPGAPWWSWSGPSRCATPRPAGSSDASGSSAIGPRRRRRTALPGAATGRTPRAESRSGDARP